MRALILSLRVMAIGCLFTLVAVAAEGEPSTKVEGAFVIPKELASFEGRVVEIRLYKHDPRLADAPANLVEKVEIKDFAHTEGKETKKDFVIGAKGVLEPKMGYYVTLFVLQNEKRTHIGECEHSKKDLCKVLTKGAPSKISMKVREVKK
jgi:hypothetical protein